MEVVRRLVRVDADVRRLDPVDRAVEALLVDVADGLRERLLEGRVEVVPELAAAADDVLPHPALRLVQRRGDAVAERRPLERGRDAVLVEAVPALVHRREDRRDVVLLVARRQADVLRAGAGRERVHGQVEPGERLVEAEAPDDLERVRVLRVDRPRAGHEGVVAVDRADLGDQRDELSLQVVEHRPHLGRLHPRLEVVEEDVVGLVVALEALDVAALQLDGALEVGEEEREVVLLARLRPDVVRLRGGAGHLGGQLGGDAAQLVVVAARRADQRRLVGVVVELLLVLGEILEQRRRSRRRRTSRARSGRASSAAARGPGRRPAASSRSGPRTASPATDAGRGSRPGVSSARQTLVHVSPRLAVA